MGNPLDVFNGEFIQKNIYFDRQEPEEYSRVYQQSF